jgi:hypothetical protein
VTKRLGAALMVAVACTAAGCDEKLSELAGPTPNLTPTFSSIYQEILVSANPAGRQACVRCHTPGRSGFREVGMDFSTPDIAYAHLVGVRSVMKPSVLRVAPGDPKNSFLIHKLEGRDLVGVRMPQNADPLTSGQIQIIARWIERGAPRD